MVSRSVLRGGGDRTGLARRAEEMKAIEKLQHSISNGAKIVHA